MKQLILVAFIVFWANTLLGQRYVALKFAPLCALEPYYNTFEFGVDYRFADNWSVQSTLGYGNHLTSPWHGGEAVTYQDEFYRTWRYRVEGRYHLNVNKRNETYFALNLTYKDARIFEDGFIGEGCDGDGDCAFFRYDTYFIDKDLLSLHFKIGWQNFLGKRFLIDIFGGVGVRTLFVDAPFRQGGIDNWAQDVIDRRSPGNTFNASISAGIKFGYFLSSDRYHKID